jgi:hypothetical protein
MRQRRRSSPDSARSLNSFKSNCLSSEKMIEEHGLPWQLSKPNLGFPSFDTISNSSRKKSRQIRLA